MTTLRRELRTKFEEILHSFSDKLTQAELEATADLLADAAMLLRGFQEKPEKRGDLVDAMLFYGNQIEHDVEDMLNRLDRELKVNISRTNGNQTIARKIIQAEKRGQSLDRFITWLKSDEWRAAHLYVYADLAKLWQIFPQAFAVDNSPARPEYQPYRTDEQKEAYVTNPRRR